MTVLTIMTSLSMSASGDDNHDVNNDDDDIEDDAEDNDDDLQSPGPQGSSSAVPGVKVDPGAQGLLHRGQGDHHPHPQPHLHHLDLYHHQQELCFRR